MNNRSKRIVILIAVIAGLLTAVVLIACLQICPRYWNAEKLIRAIRAEDTAKVQQLLDAGVDPNQTNIPPSYIWSIVEACADRPLSVACETGNLEIVEMLIAHGATAMEIDHTGWSPLKMTLFHAHEDDLEIVRLLLANGANRHTMEPDNLIVFDAADMYPMLLGSEDYIVGYNEDVAKEITQIVELLLVDVDIHSRTSFGDTLLMYASKRGNMYLVQYLIAHGCDVTIRNDQGKTAYDLAMEYDKQASAELLKGMLDS